MCFPHESEFSQVDQAPRGTSTTRELVLHKYFPHESEFLHGYLSGRSSAENRDLSMIFGHAVPRAVRACNTHVEWRAEYSCRYSCDTAVQLYSCIRTSYFFY